MPDILIRGMEMPTGELNYREIQVWSDGTVCVRKGLAGSMQQTDAKAVELPPHGELIDLQAMLSESENGKYVWAYDLTDLPEFTKDLPVVIPAERSDADA